MIEVAIVLTFVSVMSFIYVIIQSFQEKNRQIKTRLERLKPMLPEYTEIDAELAQPLFIRLFAPLLKKFAGITTKLTPQNIKKQTEHLLEIAGFPYGLTVNDFLVVKLAAPILGVVGAFFAVNEEQGMQMKMMILVAGLVLGLRIPDFFLKRQATKRQLKLTDELPDNLDLLTVSVEAGLGFDQALLKVVEKTRGPLAQEFKKVLHEVRIGKPRRDALKEMSGRVGVEELQTFVAAVVQAEQLGVSIGNVLRIQAQQLRQKRRLKAEEKAQKAPVKMLIPMILFIFPSLFIVLLGPGALQIVDNFSKMNK